MLHLVTALRSGGSLRHVKHSKLKHTTSQYYSDPDLFFRDGTVRRTWSSSSRSSSGSSNGSICNNRSKGRNHLLSCLVKKVCVTTTTTTITTTPPSSLFTQRCYASTATPKNEGEAEIGMDEFPSLNMHFGDEEAKKLREDVENFFQQNEEGREEGKEAEEKKIEHPFLKQPVADVDELFPPREEKKHVLFRQPWEKTLEDIVKTKMTLKVGRHIKVTAAGRIFSFSAMVFMGTHDGVAGIGYGKAKTPAKAMENAINDCHRNLYPIYRYQNRTIFSQIKVHFGKSKIVLKPTRKNGGYRGPDYLGPFFDALGIKDIRVERYGTMNPHTLYRALLKAVSKYQTSPEEMARITGKRYVSVKSLWTPPHLEYKIQRQRRIDSMNGRWMNPKEEDESFISANDLSVRPFAPDSARYASFARKEERDRKLGKKRKETIKNRREEEIDDDE